MASNTVVKVDISEFIDAVRAHPCLYAKSSEDFKNANKKKDLWASLAEKFQFKGLSY